MSDSISARLWLWLWLWVWLWVVEAIDEDGLEVLLEEPRGVALDSPSDFTSLSSSIGIADENIGDGLGDAARLIFSVRGSINVVLEAYADCVSGPSNNVEVSEYAVDPGRSSREGEYACATGV